MTENQTDDLIPFRNAKDTFFNSDDMRDWTAWGYSYADTSEITGEVSLVNFIYRVYGDRGGRGNRATM